MLRRWAPALFVLLWSTGFLGAKLGMPYAEPMTLLALRFALAAALLVALALATRAPWPSSWREAGQIAVVGVLVHAAYLGGVFAAIANGMPAGLAALIVCLQPVLVALAAGPLLGERVSLRQVAGFVLGLLGVVLVLSERIEPGTLAGFTGFDIWAVVFCGLALIGISAGTLYQKAIGQTMDLRSGTAIQYVAAGVAILPLALLFEEMTIEWTGEFVFALTWLVLVLSLGAISLLMFLIRVGAATKVASLFYLVPPMTAVLAYLLFDERLGPVALIGMAVTAFGVSLVVRQAPAERARQRGSEASR